MEPIVETFSRLAELPPAERERELGAITRANREQGEELRSLLEVSVRSEDFLESRLRSKSGARPRLHFKARDRLANFVIQRHIGSGCASVVYLAHDEVLKRRVALKIVQGQSGEGRLRAELVHENIVRLYEERTDLLPGHLVLVMEYIEGPTLKEYLDACEGVPEPGRWPLLKSMWPEPNWDLQGLQHQVEYTFSLTPVQVIQQIGMRYLEGIEYSHQMGVLHLDFKPANIIIAPPYARIMITDFNVSLTKNLSGGSDAVLGGTLEYMAPEQKQAMLSGEADAIDERADLYSIGAVLRYHKSIVAPDASWFKVAGDAELSAALDRVIEKAMSPRREDRYASASEMLREITLLHRYLPPARRLTQTSTNKTTFVASLQIVVWAVICLMPSWSVWVAPLGLALSIGFLVTQKQK